MNMCTDLLQMVGHGIGYDTLLQWKRSQLEQNFDSSALFDPVQAQTRNPFYEKLLYTVCDYVSLHSNIGLPCLGALQIAFKKTAFLAVGQTPLCEKRITDSNIQWLKATCDEIS